MPNLMPCHSASVALGCFVTLHPLSLHQIVRAPCRLIAGGDFRRRCAYCAPEHFAPARASRTHGCVPLIVLGKKSPDGDGRRKGTTALYHTWSPEPEGSPRGKRDKVSESWLA